VEQNKLPDEFVAAPIDRTHAVPLTVFVAVGSIFALATTHHRLVPPKKPKWFCH
jgi:hypothetical protein